MAGSDSKEIRIKIKVLLAVLAVAVPLLLVDMFWVLERSRRELNQAMGSQLEAMARVAASEVSRWLNGKVVNVGVLAANPEIRRVVADANRAARGLSPAALEAQAKAIDRDWETPRAAGGVSRMLANPASAYLREFVALNPSFKRVLVTDAQGLAIAGSHKSVDYIQSDEDWWTSAYGDGITGAIHVDDVRVDSVTRTNFVGINAPVLDPARGRVIGVIRTVVDVGELLPVTAQVSFGQTGEALLVMSDATVIASRNPTLVMSHRAAELEAIHEAPASRTGYGQLTLKGGGRKFAGWAAVGLEESFPGLDWMVIVSQDYDEATAPITSISNRILLSGFFAIALIALIAVYFSLHRVERMADIEQTPVG